MQWTHFVMNKFGIVHQFCEITKDCFAWKKIKNEYGSNICFLGSKINYYLVEVINIQKNLGIFHQTKANELI